jgi:hypothetical protein
MAGPGDALLCWRAIQLGMEIRTALILRLELLDWNAVGIGPGILPDAGDLLGNFHVRLVGLDAEAPVRDFSCYDGLRECTDDGELVAKVPVQSRWRSR